MNGGSDSMCRLGQFPTAGDNSTFVQPFLSYAAEGGWTYTLNTESTYDWTADAWSVPINLSVAKLTKIGAQPVSLTAGVKYWATAPDNAGPEGWGARLGLTFILP